MGRVMGNKVYSNPQLEMINKMDKSYNNKCWTYLNKKGTFYYMWWLCLKKKATTRSIRREYTEMFRKF